MRINKWLLLYGGHSCFYTNCGMIVSFVIAIVLLEFYLLINMEDELRK